MTNGREDVPHPRRQAQCGDEHRRQRPELTPARHVEREAGEGERQREEPQPDGHRLLPARRGRRDARLRLVEPAPRCRCCAPHATPPRARDPRAAVRRGRRRTPTPPATPRPRSGTACATPGSRLGRGPSRSQALVGIRKVHACTQRVTSASGIDAAGVGDGDGDTRLARVLRSWRGFDSCGVMPPLSPPTFRAGHGRSMRRGCGGHADRRAAETQTPEEIGGDTGCNSSVHRFTSACRSVSPSTVAAQSGSVRSGP